MLFIGNAVRHLEFLKIRTERRQHKKDGIFEEEIIYG